MGHVLKEEVAEVTDGEKVKRALLPLQLLRGYAVKAWAAWTKGEWCALGENSEWLVSVCSHAHVAGECAGYCELSSVWVMVDMEVKVERYQAWLEAHKAPVSMVWHARSHDCCGPDLPEPIPPAQ